MALTPLRRMDSIRAVLFDFDHTLADLGGFVRWSDARRELMALYEAGGVPESFLERTEGALSLYAHVATSGLLSDDRLAEVQRRASALIDRYETEAIDSTRVFPGVASCLSTLAARGIQAGIVTSNARSVVRSILRREALAGDFAVVVAREDVRALKPSPEGVLRACEELAVAPRQCIFVGDSVSDVEAARAAGVVAFGVRDGISTDEELTAAGAGVVLDDVGQLFAAPRLSAGLRGAP